MLGVAAEYGKDDDAVQRLIEMGALLDIPNHGQHKLALHWAINNKLSSKNKDSLEAVKVVKRLLDNGANTDITCYGNDTPLAYAKKRKFNAAAKLIEQSKRTILSLYQLSFF